MPPRRRPISAEASLTVAGLSMPLRETLLIVLTVALLLLDWFHLLVPGDDLLLARGIQRTMLFGLVPLAALLLAGERPSDFGVRIGDWRAGLLAAGGAAAVATPIILLAATFADFRFYYALPRTDVPYLALVNALDVVPAEFLFRGFLMMALIRWAGGIGVLLALLPFTFFHLGKPEPEVLSTLAGGLGFGWLAWRTRSVLYGALLHVYILTLVMVAANA